MTRLSSRLVAFFFACSGVALGQAPAPAPTPAPAAQPAAPAPATPAPAAAPATGDAKKPPILGVGPFWDAVSKGDAAYAARDFEGAIKAYREAIEKESKNPMGHYRLGSAQFSKGDFDEAEQSWQAGLRFADKDEKIRAKLLFVLAAVRERQRKLDEAETRWKEYGVQAQKPDARAFPATAAERQKRITEWKQIEVDSKAVRERIEKRLKETEESMRKSSK
jgi:tetratricopeptide (TPR) repeat protein